MYLAAVLTTCLRVAVSAELALLAARFVLSGLGQVVSRRSG